MTNLPRERQPDSALEERIVSTLVAAGLVRRRRVWPFWAAAIAAVILIAIGGTVLRPKASPPPGNMYALLLYEDSAWTAAPAGHSDERLTEMRRWGDSLSRAGEFERAGRLIGPGPAGGLFIIRAADDAHAERIAASCPFHKWGGRVVLKRFEP